MKRVSLPLFRIVFLFAFMTVSRFPSFQKEFWKRHRDSLWESHPPDFRAERNRIRSKLERIWQDLSLSSTEDIDTAVEGSQSLPPLPWPDPARLTPEWFLRIQKTLSTAVQNWCLEAVEAGAGGSAPPRGGDDHAACCTQGWWGMHADMSIIEAAFGRKSPDETFSWKTFLSADPKQEPWPDSKRLLTSLREPVSRTMSEFFYMQEHQGIVYDAQWDWINFNDPDTILKNIVRPAVKAGGKALKKIYEKQFLKMQFLPAVFSKDGGVGEAEAAGGSRNNPALNRQVRYLVGFPRRRGGNWRGFAENHPAWKSRIKPYLEAFHKGPRVALAPRAKAGSGKNADAGGPRPPTLGTGGETGFVKKLPPFVAFELELKHLVKAIANLHDRVDIFTLQHRVAESKCMLTALYGWRFKAEASAKANRVRAHTLRADAVVKNNRLRNLTLALNKWDELFLEHAERLFDRYLEQVRAYVCLERGEAHYAFGECCRGISMRT